MSDATRRPSADAELRVLSTMNEDGSRRWLRPKPSPGSWLNRRRIVGYSLIALFAGLPYVRIDGKPGILLDLASREFTFFGRTLYATDTAVLAPAMLAIFVTIFLLTALFGRVWCGWGCPQTVYMELVYRPVERFFEGHHYRTGGRSGVSGIRLAGKYLTFLVISFFLSHIFLAYFVGTEQLWGWMHGSPFNHPAAFFLVLFVTVMMMLDFAFMREQVCILMCPYGRLQSALLDDSSLIVAYDTHRGEPRGKRSKKSTEPLGDCIDCYKCVATCPTGIDIRDGLQMECVHCTQCIDACDDVMEKIGKPKGLIRYGSQQAMSGEKTKGIRPRVIIYPLILAVAITLLGLALNRQSTFDVTFLRNRNATFTVADDGSIVNLVQLKIQNRDSEERSYTVELDGEGQISSGDLPLVVAGQATGSIMLRVSTDAGVFDRGRGEVSLRILEDSGAVVERSHRILGPLFAPAKDRQPAREETSEP